MFYLIFYFLTQEQVIFSQTTYITYDESTFRSFQIKNKGFYCFNNMGRTQDIKFRDSFQNIPNVILIPELYDIPGSRANYNLKITEITLTKFSLSITCTEGMVYGIYLKWLAIDDARVQVINQFNIQNFEKKTFDHINSNAQKYFISVISFSFSGPVSFKVQVTEITTKNLTITITDPQNLITNLIKLSYQIILGIDEIFNQYDLLQINSPFVSQHFPLIEKSWFIIPINGFYYDAVDRMKFKKIYHSDQSFQWFELITDCCCIPVGYHVPQWMKFQHITDMKPYEISQIKIKQIIDSRIDYINSFQILFEGKAEKITSLGEIMQIIDKTENDITLNIHTLCNENEQLKINLNIPLINFPNPYILKCLDSFQEIVYSITLLPASIAFQELIFKISESECKISQLLFNYQQNVVELFSIQKLSIQSDQT
ncbi:unnamed protein product [Paramecium sonneborni]|uniref:H-type lectin domain-containing protein n=1 Tax=Paramecium sonneborni TaxID=65129 RepID=A0A8S1QS42_9CILI|nr:unnamed protein product [Paramecium sonneborni]